MFELDHLAVSAGSLAEAVAHVEDALGVAMGPGGQHAHFGTHNQLLGLADGLYLEAIAIDPDAAPLGYARWFDLDRRSGPARLTNWIVRCGDVDAAVAAMGSGIGAPVALARGDLRWSMAVPESGILPFDNMHPAIIQWHTQPTPGALLASSGCRLVALEVSHPEAAELKAHLAPVLPSAIVTYSTGPIGLEAHFDTPHGRRVLR